MEEYGEDAASAAEQLQIAQHFVASAPPGEVNDVLRDVAKLVSGEVLSEAALHEALHAYNIQHLLPVDVPDADYKILICEDAQLDATHYLDPIGRRVLGFDHVKQQVIADDVTESPTAFGSSLEKERKKLQEAFKGYIQFEYMQQGTVGVYVHGSSLVVDLCTERINLRNFWSGRWMSRWVIKMASNPPQVSGKIDLHVHYFENGNLQLQCAKDVEPHDLETDRSTALQDSLLHVVKEAEDDLQSNLEDMYINMSQETFKEMRRVMPVTQTKMEWNLHAHRTAKDLGRM